MVDEPLKLEWISTLVALHLDEQDRTPARDETHDDLLLSVAMGEVSSQDAIARLSGDQDAMRRVALFSPLSEEERARERDALLTEAFGPESSTGSDLDESSVEPSKALRVVPQESESKEHSRHFSRWLGGGVAAAAAALIVWTVFSPTTPPAPPSVLSSYSLDWSGGYAGPIRSADGADVEDGCDQRLRMTDPLTLYLRPLESTSDEVQLATLARLDDGEPQWLQGLDWTLSDKGVISIVHEWAELELPPGRWTLTFFVVHADSKPSTDVLEDAVPGQHPGFTAVRGTVCVAPD